MIFRLPLAHQAHSNHSPTPSSTANASKSNATTTDPSDHFPRRQSSLNCCTVHITNITNITNSPAAKSK
ncbi:hypothetical protein [Kingella oralis]|uniref:hypothetical protein n=1 Tax=Kingella oralis TaxID=505 RepID=UPI0034E3E466